MAALNGQVVVDTPLKEEGFKSTKNMYIGVLLNNHHEWINRKRGKVWYWIWEGGGGYSVSTINNTMYVSTRNTQEWKIKLFFEWTKIHELVL